MRRCWTSSAAFEPGPPANGPIGSRLVALGGELSARRANPRPTPDQARELLSGPFADYEAFALPLAALWDSVRARTVSACTMA